MKHSANAAYYLILIAVHVNGTLVEPFTAKDLRRIVPGWRYPDHFSFLAYNCTDNLPDEVAMFIRVGRGQYRLTPRNLLAAAFDRPPRL
ncbi:hypothetical protein [Ochrobactrum teleogrylli]